MTARRNLEWSDGAAGPVLEALAGDQTSDWRDYALCAQTDPEIFFPEKGGSNRAAKQVCASCFVRVQCLEWALETQQQHGVLGGLSDRERRRMRREVA